MSVFTNTQTTSTFRLWDILTLRGEIWSLNYSEMSRDLAQTLEMLDERLQYSIW